MTNKYVTTPCILHFPRHTCVGEETKYVVKEGAKGTTRHAKTNDEPPHMSLSMRTNRNHTHISPSIHRLQAP